MFLKAKPDRGKILYNDYCYWIRIEQTPDEHFEYQLLPFLLLIAAPINTYDVGIYKIVAQSLK